MPMETAAVRIRVSKAFNHHLEPPILARLDPSSRYVTKDRALEGSARCSGVSNHFKFRFRIGKNAP